jgi:hypothetical protein
LRVIYHLERSSVSLVCSLHLPPLQIRALATGRVPGQEAVARHAPAVLTEVQRNVAEFAQSKSIDLNAPAQSPLASSLKELMTSLSIMQ